MMISNFSNKKLNFALLKIKKEIYSNRFKKFGATAKGVFWKIILLKI